jgi:hypothetical protein
MHRLALKTGVVLIIAVLLPGYPDEPAPLVAKERRRRLLIIGKGAGIT